MKLTVLGALLTASLAPAALALPGVPQPHGPPYPITGHGGGHHGRPAPTGIPPTTDAAPFDPAPTGSYGGGSRPGRGGKGHFGLPQGIPSGRSGSESSEVAYWKRDPFGGLGPRGAGKSWPGWFGGHHDGKGGRGGISPTATGGGVFHPRPTGHD